MFSWDFCTPDNLRIVARICGAYSRCMETKHILWAVLVTAIWGVNFVVIRLGLDEFPPILLNALRFAATGLLFVWFVPRPNVSFKNIALISLVLYVGQFSFLFIGMKAGMPAGLTSLVLQSQAIFTVLIAISVLGERPNRSQIIGICIAFTGLAVIALDFGQSAALLAFLIVIVAAVCWSVGNILVKRSHADHMLGLMVWACLFAAPPLFLLSWMVEGSDQIVTALSQFSLKGLAVIAYMTVFSTLVGYGLWTQLLKLYPASLVAPFTLLVPAFGMTSAALILGETLSPLKGAGSLLIVLGLIVNTGLWRRFQTAFFTA